MTILLLTKSLSFEQDFVRDLNNLGHEVLCSKKFLNDLQTNDYFGMDLNYFDILILSATISDQEVAKILPFFLNFSCEIYRKTMNAMSQDTIQSWKRLGITGFIAQNIQFDDLREKLISCNEKKTLLRWDASVNEEATLDSMLRSFSKQELQIFQILQDSPLSYITRESLSQQLWGESPTKSKESRLSGIIRSIKKKLSDYGFDESCLETSWGRGYHLNPLKKKVIRTEIQGELKVVES